MLAEPQEVKLIADSYNMQKLSSNQLPDLIRSFELKGNQQKDVPQVKTKKPAAKMKLRDPQQVLEIARLKVLVSEMREKTMKLEAQLELANNEKETGEHVQETSKHDTRFLVEQEMKLEKDKVELQAHIESLQNDVNLTRSKLSRGSDLNEELTAAKSRIKTLQEEIRDDAGLTKAQLLVLKKQFGDLEEISEHNELEFQRAAELSRALEAEVAELKKGNQELLKQKEELGQKLSNVVEKAKKFTPITKDDLLASEAEVSELRHNNAELQKKVESLQMSRFNEVEELVYLRWVNACLRHDLDIYRLSRTKSDNVSSQVDGCVTDVHSKDEPMLHTTSGRCSLSYNTTHDYPASQDESKSVSGRQEWSIMGSPQIFTVSDHVNKGVSSPVHINRSPLIIPHRHVSISHSSPLVSPLGHLNDNQLLTTLDGSLKHSPRDSLQGRAKTNPNVLPLTQQGGSVSPYLSKLSNKYNDRQYSLRKMAVDKDPQVIEELQSLLTYNGHRTKPLDTTSLMATSSQSSLRSTGRNFRRSASTISASSDRYISQTQGSPQKENFRTFMRSSSTLSADSFGHYQNMKSNTSLRRNSATSVVLAHERQSSDLESVPFPPLEKLTEPFKREDSTNVKAQSFESHRDASDIVVAAFQRLSASTQTTVTHPTFKDLSRQNSRDDRAASKVEAHNKHEPHPSTKKSTQEDFICDLARAVQVTHYNSIEQVAAFVSWFDRQGDVEKQEFFNFPDCPRNKIEAMRRTLYEYEELQAFETALDSYKDNLKLPADLALQDMKNLLDKVENHIKGFKQARELAMAQFIELHIPTYWMLDSGKIAKIKQAALKLAQTFMKQVTEILVAHVEPGITSRDQLLLEAAKFILQIHNFAGGFDEETAKAFKTLQNQANIKENDGAY